MNRYFIRYILLVLFFVTTITMYGAVPSKFEQRKKLGVLRDAYRKAEKMYSALDKHAVTSSANWLQRQKDMKRLLSQMAVAETSRTKTAAGPSLMWKQRNRSVPMPVVTALDYSAGPNGAVVPFSGEFTDTASEISGVDRGGVGFSFERNYSSFSNYDCGLGTGWNFNYNAGIIIHGKELRHSEKLIFFVGNRDIRFEKHNGKWFPESGAFLNLEHNQKQIMIYSPDLTRYEFELAAEQIDGFQRWRLSAIASRHDKYRANRLEIAYLAGCDRIAHITDPLGHKYSFAYNASGHIIQISSDREFVNFSYNTTGKLLTNVYYMPFQLSISGGTFAPEISYQYTSGNNPLLCRKSSNGLKHIAIVEYDNNQRVKKAGFVADDKQQMWEFSYLPNHVTAVKSPVPTPETHYCFSGTPHPSLPSSIVIPAQKARWQYGYNSDFMLTSITEPLGNRKIRTYDSKNANVLARANMLEEKHFPATGIPSDQQYFGSRSKYHEKIALPVKIEFFQVDNGGKETILKREVLDYSNNDFMQICHDNGGIKQYAAYNRFGLPVLEWDANKNVTISYYAKDLPQSYDFSFDDGSVLNGGPLVRVIQDAKTSEIENVCKAIGHRKCFRNEITRVPPQALETRNAYDPFGNRIHRKCGFEESFSIFSSNGKLLITCNAATGFTEYQYFRSGRTKHIYHEFCPDKKQNFQGDLSPHFVGSNYYTESFKYDSFDMLTEHIVTNERFDNNPVVYRYTRLPNGKVCKITNPMGVSRIDEYDINTGRLQRQLLENNKTVVFLTSNYQYYPNGQIKSYTDHFGGNNHFRLDGFARVAAETNAKGVTTHRTYDGLNRVIENTATFDGKVLNRNSCVYSAKNQKVEAEYVWQIDSERNIKLEQARYVYDDAGNLIAKRGVRKNSWQYFLIDGSGNTVAEINPEGDISVKLLRSGKTVYSTSTVYRKDRVSSYSSGNLSEYDFAGRIIRRTPVDNDGKLITERSEIFNYNTVGQKIKTTSQKLTSTKVVCNSLGKIIREEITPYSSNFGELPHVTSYKYMADGQLKQQIFENRALALRGKKDNVKPELVNAPQITRYKYDSLGRLIQTINPDGLITANSFNEYSLKNDIKWFHISEPEKILRHLQLKYNTAGEVTSIKDGIIGKVLRKYKYDEVGNCTSAVDFSNPHPVSIERFFDSLGNMIQEKINYDGKKLPWSKFSYDFVKGESIASWKNLLTKSSKFWHSEKRIVDNAGRVIGISLDNNSNNFVEWSYLGSLAEKIHIPESRLSKQTKFTSLLEPAKTEFTDKYGNIVGCLEYDYGPQGQPIYAATKLDVVDKYQFAAYSQFDVYRRLVGQNGEAVVPATQKDARLRRNQVLSNEAVATVNTSRMIYDQANNIWGRYSGKQLSEVNPQNLNKERMPHFSSPASVITVNSNLPDLALLELASNREVTTAAYTSDSNLKATEFKYDKLGNLIEFEGTFWNGNRRYPVKWSLTFDSLGRLSAMRAVALEDQGIIKKNEPAAELTFAYDAENRRLMKQVTDFTHINGTAIRSEITLFRGNQQVLFFDSSNTLKLIGEYLWGAAERELLMATLPENKAETQGDFKNSRYFFQQDKGLNVVFTSKVERGRIIPVAAESYLGFGDNSTFAKITGIKSSMQSQHTALAYNSKLDEEIEARWGNPGNLQYIELQLDKNNTLGQLTIWSESFPKDFLVFVLPELESYAGNLAEWLRNGKNWGNYLAAAVKDGKFDNMVMGESLIAPYRLPLRELKGNRVLLVFENSALSTVNVREFEVLKVADNPSAISFAGQWLDRETGMYYQVNRYRLAGSDKFISPDPIGFLDGNNLYAYAKGNPLEWHDPDGRFGHILAGAGIGALFGGGSYLVQWMINGGEFSWTELAIQTSIGAVSGAVGAATFGIGSFGLHGWQGAVLAGVMSGAAAGSAAGGLDAGIHSALKGDSIGEIFSQTAWGTFKGGVIGAIASGVASGTIQALNIKPVQSVINRSLAFIRHSTGIHVKRVVAKGILNAGLAEFMGGGSSGTISGVFHGIETGDWSTILSKAGRGMLQGASGALIAHAALSGVDHLTKRSWDKDRAAYWREEAKNNPADYSEANITRMKQGLAPRRINPTTGKIESMELHHDLIPQRSGLPRCLIDQKFNLRKVWPDEHRAIDVYRN